MQELLERALCRGARLQLEQHEFGVEHDGPLLPAEYALDDWLSVRSAARGPHAVRAILSSLPAAAEQPEFRTERHLRLLRQLRKPSRRQQRPLGARRNRHVAGRCERLGPAGACACERLALSEFPDESSGLLPGVDEHQCVDEDESDRHPAAQLAGGNGGRRGGSGADQLPAACGTCLSQSAFGRRRGVFELGVELLRQRVRSARAFVSDAELVEASDGRTDEQRVLQQRESRLLVLVRRRVLRGARRQRMPSTAHPLLALAFVSLHLFSTSPYFHVFINK